MRAVVLARGLASRMREPDTGPPLATAQRAAADAGQKAMMPTAGGRPFLDFVLSSLADAGCGDVALVVGPEHEEIRGRYRVVQPPRRLTVHFAEQPEPLGTADAVLAAERWTAGEPFLTLNADNIYPADVLRALGALDGPGLPVFARDELIRSSNIPAERVAAFALLEVGPDGWLHRIVEKPGVEAMAAAGPSALVSMNCWRFDARIFDACRAVPRSPRGEFELPLAVGVALVQGVRFKTIPARGPVLDLSRRSDVAEVTRRLAGVEPDL